MSREFAETLPAGDALQYSRSVLFARPCVSANGFDVSGTGADFTLTPASGAALFNATGLRLKTRATDPAEDDYAKAVHPICFPSTRLLTVRARISSPDISTVKAYGILVQFFNTDTNSIASILHEPNTPRLTYRNAAGGETEITGCDQVTVDGAWHLLQFQLDLTTGKYTKVLFNGIETTIDAAYQTAADATGFRYATAEAYLVAAGAAQGQMDFASFYIGQSLNE